jgi:hypothetical protein
VKLIEQLFVASIVVVLFAGCGLLSKRVKLGEEFTMKPKEKVVVPARLWKLDWKAWAIRLFLSRNPGHSDRPM